MESLLRKNSIVLNLPHQQVSALPYPEERLPFTKDDKPGLRVKTYCGNNANCVIALLTQIMAPIVLEYIFCVNNAKSVKVIR